MQYKDVTGNDADFKTSANKCGKCLLPGYQYLGLLS